MRYFQLFAWPWLCFCLVYVLASSLLLFVIAIMECLLLAYLLRKRGGLKYFIIFQATCFLFLFRINILEPDYVLLSNKSKINFIGKVLSYSYHKDYTTYSIKTNSTTALVTTNSSEIFLPGDYIQATCNPKPAPSEWTNNQFLLTCFSGDQDIKLFKKANAINSIIHRAQTKIKSILKSKLKETASSLAIAMTLGDKKLLSHELKNNFARSGLSHLLAISGLHLSIIVTLLAYTLIHLGVRRTYLFFPVVFLIFLYLVLTGFMTSTVRAGIFLSYAWLAILFGRLINKKYLILLSLTCISLINPFALKSISLQLSFGAIIGLFYLTPIISRLLVRIISNKHLCQTISATISIEIIIWPIINHHFRELSLVSILANIPAIPLTAMSLITVFLGLISIILLPGLDTFVFLIANLILNLLTKIAHLFAIIPTIKLPDFSATIIVLYYFLVTMSLFIYNHYSE